MTGSCLQYVSKFLRSLEIELNINFISDDFLVLHKIFVVVLTDFIIVVIVVFKVYCVIRRLYHAESYGGNKDLYDCRSDSCIVCNGRGKIHFLTFEIYHSENDLYCGSVEQIICVSLVTPNYVGSEPSWSDGPFVWSTGQMNFLCKQSSTSGIICVYIRCK